MQRLVASSGEPASQKGLRAGTTGHQMGASPEVAAWSAPVIAAAGINIACVATLTGLTVQSLEGGSAIMYRWLGSQAEWLNDLASRSLPSGLSAHVEATLGAGGRVAALAAATGAAICALLPCLVAILAPREPRKPCVATVQPLVTSVPTGRVSFWRRVFLLLCTLTASELSALACVNWAAGYAAALVLVPLSMAGYRMLL